MQIVTCFCFDESCSPTLAHLRMSEFGTWVPTSESIWEGHLVSTASKKFKKFLDGLHEISSISALAATAISRFHSTGATFLSFD